uniref:Uncharacterized protein n=1 Tax=Anopheles culicifacies TaxID=139723 RepID=A0A182M4F7_9DIPT
MAVSVHSLQSSFYVTNRDFIMNSGGNVNDLCFLSLPDGASILLKDGKGAISHAGGKSVRRMILVNDASALPQGTQRIITTGGTATAVATGHTKKHEVISKHFR